MAINGGNALDEYTQDFFLRTYPNDGTLSNTSTLGFLPNEDYYRENILKITKLLYSAIENSPRVQDNFKSGNNKKQSYFKIDSIELGGAAEDNEVGEDSDDYRHRILHFG